MEDSFSRDQGVGGLGEDSSTFIVHFISTILTSVPPQIIKHEISEVKDPCIRVLMDLNI